MGLGYKAERCGASSQNLGSSWDLEVYRDDKRIIIDGPYYVTKG